LDARIVIHIGMALAFDGDITMTQQTQASEKEVEVEMPILSVDETESVKERMTGNAYHNILPARYLLEGEDPEDLFNRVAENVAGAESDEVAQEMWADEFEHMMSTLQFMPNSPTLMNAGASLQQLSACFVLEPGDSMAEEDEFGRESILDTVKHAGQIFKSGGGVGYSFSHLRPKGAYIRSTESETSGPMQFMRLYDETCETVKQGGKRRGAQMGIMRIDHADIGRFITAKRVEGVLDNFNISVALTDEFIEAVRNDEDYAIYDPQSDFSEPQAVLEETKKFYSPEYADNPKDFQQANAEDKVGMELVDENLWRDYADTIVAHPDYDTDEKIPLAEKWDQSRFSLEVGEEMTLPARFIWDLIIDGAWRNGEPGLFHYDETNRKHSFDADEYPQHAINATNPCVTGDTLVNTPNGLIRAENVSEGNKISTVYGTESVDEILTFEDKEVYQVNLSDGGSVKATEDHRFHVLDGKKSVDKNTPLRDISEGDKIRLEPSTLESKGTEEDYKYQLRRGILTGDGGYTQKTIDVNNRLSISSSEDDTTFNQNVRELFEDAGYNVGELDTSGRNKSVKLWIADAEKVIEDHNLNPEYSYEKSVDVTEFKTRAGVQGFLDGMLATDGSVSMSSNRPQIRWSTSSEKLANNIRNLALNVGMHARIYEDKRKNRGGTRGDGSEIGNDETYTLYNIHIAGESADTFVRNTRLSNYHTSKGERLETLRTDFMLTGGLWKATVESIEVLEEKETVFDLYCSGSDTWVTEGYVNRGCAEQPLSAFEACNLGHVNLSLMMKSDSIPFEEWKKTVDYDYQFEKNAVTDYCEENVDWEQLQMITRHGTRFLDNVVTQSEFPLEQISERVKGQRKIGLGIMGWAQMLYQMGIPYGSDNSYQAARVVMGFIDKESVQMSHELAQERGSFDYWDESKYADPQKYREWFEGHTYESADDWEDGFPIRNHNTTTIAPTGTTSMIGNTTGGCEPAYNVANFKNVGDDIQGSDMLVEFDDYFLKTLEANGLDVESIKEDAETKMRNNEFDGVDDLDIPENIAKVFVTTNDLSSREHGMMQRAFQEFVDSGISKTINAPNDATRNDVHEAFMLALDEDELGQTIKGLTFYRDGSRDEQVLTTRVDNNLDKKQEAAREILIEMDDDAEWTEEDIEQFLEDAENYVESEL